MHASSPRRPEPLTRTWQPGWPVDLTTTLGPLAHGAFDPAIRLGPDGVWRTTRAATGPATVHYSRVGDAVLIRAWGAGADEELERAPAVLGAGDDPTGFDAGAHPVMAAAFRRFGPGWRVPRTGRVLEALVPAVLEQRVTGLEAKRAWAWLVRAHGHPAPGAARGGGPGAGPSRTDAAVPVGLMVAPDALGWAQIPSWEWHRAGVDPGRARTIATATARSDALERLSDRPPKAAGEALRTLPGIGAWTAAEVAVRAWGDADAVSFGDYHLARAVVHALTGRMDGTDDEMAELLTPWAGQRARAVRLIELHCGPPPRRGPRASPADHRRH